MTDEMSAEVMETIIAPIMKGLERENINFRGVIYVGLMICDGKPYVLEFNVRFGDPEAQPILSRLDCDLFDLLKATAEGSLNEIDVTWKEGASICVVLASKGYPGPYKKGDAIKGLDEFKHSKNVVVFHAGTSFSNGEVVTSGGRVLGVAALGDDIKSAQVNAYKAIEKINFDGMQVRKDIGNKAIKE